MKLALLLSLLASSALAWGPSLDYTGYSTLADGGKAINVYNYGPSSGGGGGGPVTQSGAWNVTAIVDGGSIVCTQPTGTNLHVVVDTAPATSVASGLIVNIDGGVTIANASLAVTQSGAWTNACTLSGQMVSIDGGVSIVSMPAITGTVVAVVDGGIIAAVQSGAWNATVIVDGGSLVATQGGAWNLTCTIDGGITINAMPVDKIAGNAGGVLDAANNGTAPANVLVMGAELQSGATATAGTAGQVGRPVASLDHVLYSRAGGPVQWSGFAEAITATTQILAAPAAGLKAYVTGITCSNEAYGPQGVDIVYGTGANCVTGITALTHKMRMGPQSDGGTSAGIVADDFITPLQPAAANAICVRPTAATAFGCTLVGYTAP